MSGSFSTVKRSARSGKREGSEVVRTALTAARRRGFESLERASAMVSMTKSVPSHSSTLAGGFPFVGRVPHHLPSQGWGLRWTSARNCRALRVRLRGGGSPSA